jgi:5-methylcytosine-specific restriction protein A
MQINDIKRYWMKDNWERKNKDPFYQSSLWKDTKTRFKEAAPWLKLPAINGIPYSNRYCADCWENGIINDERIEIDHIEEVKDGGSRTAHSNLRSRCHAHHNRKTHLEGKKRGKGKDDSSLQAV